ncbi:hypothetical protein C8Q74DRAFT_1367063 [Fomes fomentarius]|nr:hypothetical protein C8Q74DRAFT_1367063 [Fomes fomentarius]
MGNSYSVAREEQEEEEFRRLVEAVEIAQQRSTGRDDLEAGLNDLRPPDPQRERPEDLGHDVLPDYIARPGPQFDVPWMQPQSPAPIIICPQAPALQPLQAPACFIATTPSTQSQASQDSVLLSAAPATASRNTVQSIAFGEPGSLRQFKPFTFALTLLTTMVDTGPSTSDSVVPLAFALSFTVASACTSLAACFTQNYKVSLSVAATVSLTLPRSWSASVALL